MNDIIATKHLLPATKDAFGSVRHSVVVAMQLLSAVKDSGVWEQVANSWGEYVESELGISQSFASKLLTVNAAYILQGKVSPEKLEGIDYERLYLAQMLSGSVEEQIEKARTLTRKELKEERNDEEPHTHQWIQICKHCQIRNND